MPSRSDIRKQMRERRRALSPEQRAAAAARLASHFTRTDLFRRARRVAFYCPADGEMDPLPLMQRGWASGMRGYLPVLSIPFHNRLWFARYEVGDRLLANRFGIPEPVAGSRTVIRPYALDIVLMPLVAFDGEGNRLGMGGGFYDRTLAYLRGRRHWRKPVLLGLAYEFQRSEDLRAESWDVPLDGVLTEERLYLRRSPAAPAPVGEKES